LYILFAILHTKYTKRRLNDSTAHGHPGLDPRKIGVAGFSAGGELSTAAAVEYPAFGASAAFVAERGGPSRGPFCHPVPISTLTRSKIHTITAVSEHVWINIGT
jgi:dienelactone hydrolase